MPQVLREATRFVVSGVPSGSANDPHAQMFSQFLWALDLDSVVLLEGFNAAVAAPSLAVQFRWESTSVTQRYDGREYWESRPFLSKGAGHEDIEGESPNSLQLVRAGLKSRAFQRINDPRVRGRS